MCIRDSRSPGRPSSLHPNGTATRQQRTRTRPVGAVAERTALLGDPGFLWLWPVAGVHALRVSDDSDSIGFDRRPRRSLDAAKGDTALADLRIGDGLRLYHRRPAGGAAGSEHSGLVPKSVGCLLYTSRCV